MFDKLLKLPPPKSNYYHEKVFLFSLEFSVAKTMKTFFYPNNSYQPLLNLTSIKKRGAIRSGEDS